MSLDINYYFQHTDKFPIDSFFSDITATHEIIPRAKKFLAECVTAPDLHEFRGEKRGAGPTLLGNYFVGEGSVIYNDVTIIGPVYIGKNVEIMPGAIIRPNTIIGDNCSVGHGSELKSSVLFNGSKVASLAFVGDSVLGVSARIGSGVITGNRKFDQSDVTISLDGEKSHLGSDYFGLVLGDASRLGANCTTQPGTHIGHDTWIFPAICVRGFTPSQTRVTVEQNLTYAPNPIIKLKP